MSEVEADAINPHYRGPNQVKAEVRVTETVDHALLDIERVLMERADQVTPITLLMNVAGETRVSASRRLIDVKRIIPALRAEGYEVVKRGEVPPWMEAAWSPGLRDGERVALMHEGGQLYRHKDAGSDE